MNNKRYGLPPLIWVGALVLVGLSVFAFVWLQPGITDDLQLSNKSSDPVKVTAAVRPANGDMWLPTNVKLDGEQVYKLNRMDSQEQRTWLTGQGASPLGWRDVELILESNRADPVQIIDIRPVSNCSELSQGSWVILKGPSGNLPDTTRMLIAADQPNERPQILNMEAYEPGSPLSVPGVEGFPLEADTDYFDNRPITLDPYEQEALYISLNSQNAMCAVNLEVTTLDGGEVRTQLVFEEGREPLVGPQNSGSYREHLDLIYMGGDMCRRYVETTFEIIESNGGDLMTACGPGNFAFNPYEEFG